MVLYQELLDSQAAFASASRTVAISVPPGTDAATFSFRISAVAGTTPIADCKLQYVDPQTGVAVDIDNAAFAQQIAAGLAVLSIGPGLVTDNSGSHRAAQAAFGSRLNAVFTFDRTTGDETYTYTLSVEWQT